MKAKQTVMFIKLSVIALLFISTISLSMGLQAFAADAPEKINYCGGVETSLITCDEPGGSTTDISETGVWGILILAINILSAGVGVAALAGIVYGAALYTTAEGSAEKVKKAIEVFRNVVIGVVAYALMYAGLNFLIPGGLFN